MFTISHIGVVQHNLVHGRQMSKVLRMLIYRLETATLNDTLKAESSRTIILLTFRKTYETVYRFLLYDTIRQFGFSK